MKTSHLFLLLFAGIATFACCLTSCQPEVDPLPNQRVDSTGGLLSYIDGKSGNDTFYVNYNYDVQNRWAGGRFFVFTGGDTVAGNIGITRDAAGYVTKVVFVDSSDVTNIGIETEVVQHNTAGRYTRKILSDNAGSTPDTTDFVYDNAGRIIKTYEFNSNFADTIPYGYHNGNLDTLGYFPVPANYNSVILKYDNKIAPSNLGIEAFLIDIPFVWGTANITMYTRYESGTITNQAVISYTYNAANKPVKAILTVLPANHQVPFNYHYR